MTKISAVTVCINYDDFLVHCIDNYIAAFDELIVVTESEDLKTRKLCEKFGVRIVESKSKQYNGEPFNLPALLNDGFATIESPEWLCKIDPDIYIPKTAVSRFRQSFGAFDEIWGASRYFCEDTAQLESFIETNDFEVLEPPYEEGDDVLGGRLRSVHSAAKKSGGIGRSVLPPDRHLTSFHRPRPDQGHQASRCAGIAEELDCWAGLQPEAWAQSSVRSQLRLLQLA